MEKAEVLRLFLGKGYQIDVESLNYFSKNEKQLQKFLSEMDSQKFPSTITKDFVDSFLQSDVEIFSAAVEKRQLSAEEIAKILMQRFSIIKRILITHLDLINLLSINKINQKTKKFSLIGIVSRIDDSTKTISVADDTGEIDLRIEKKFLNDILVNDVLGFICEYDEAVKIRNIVFPDVPLRRNTKTLVDVKHVVIAEKISEEMLQWCKEQQNPIYLFTFLHPAEQKEIPKNVKLIFVGEGPSFALISRMFSAVFFDGSFLNNEIGDKKIDDFLILLFKKRYLNATKKLDGILMNNAFVLENVPDIIAIRGLKEAVQTNYKGTTILTVTENTSWIVNLKSREIIKLSSH